MPQWPALVAALRSSLLWIGIYDRHMEVQLKSSLWNTWADFAKVFFSDMEHLTWHVLFLHKSFFKLCLRKWAACQRPGKSFAWRPLLGALWLAEMRLWLGAWTTGQWHTLLPCNRWVEDISKFNSWVEDIPKFEALSYFHSISFCAKALDLQMYYPFRLQFHRLFSFLCDNCFWKSWSCWLHHFLLVQAGVRLPSPAHLWWVRWHQLVFGHANFRKLRGWCEPRGLVKRACCRVVV